MATVYVTEFTSVISLGGKGGSAAFQPPCAEQTVAIGGGSTQSNAFGTNTNLVRIHADAICSIEIGSNPTATTVTARFAANQTEYFGVQSGHKIAVITNV
jgi:hypothetical protein